MVFILKRVIVASIVMISCSAAAAVTFFLAPLWGLMLLSVPNLLGVYLCITAFTGDPEFLGSFKKKPFDKSLEDENCTNSQPADAVAPLPV